VERPDAVSRGVTESEALTEVLGEGQLTGNREADLIKAITEMEAKVARVPLLLRILYHGLYAELKPDNHDVWHRVGLAVGWPARQAKNKAWRRAHPPGLETEPAEGQPAEEVDL
jgi:hypothetical protein